jgi:hypothetical protein
MMAGGTDDRSRNEFGWPARRSEIRGGPSHSAGFIGGEEDRRVLPHLRACLSASRMLLKKKPLSFMGRHRRPFVCL